MVDFAKLSRERYERAAPEERERIDRAREERRVDEARPRVTVGAVRTSCLTGVDRVVQIVLVVRPGRSDGKDWFFIDEGGVTGYESIPVEAVARAVDEGRGWEACHGTEGRWDGMVVPVESLRAARDALAPREASQLASQEAQGLAPRNAG